MNSAQRKKVKDGDGDGIAHGYLPKNIAHMPNAIENHEMHFTINQPTSSHRSFALKRNVIYNNNYY